MITYGYPKFEKWANESDGSALKKQTVEAVAKAAKKEIPGLGNMQALAFAARWLGRAQ